MIKYISIIIIASVVMSLTGCSSENPMPQPEYECLHSSRMKRSLSEVISIAGQFGRQSGQDTRATPLLVEENTITPIVGCRTRSENDTLIYAVNFQESNGYLLISANRSAEPILAFVDEGYYIDGEDMHSDGFNLFLDNAKTYVGTSNPLKDFPVIDKEPTPNPFPDPNDGMEDLIMTHYNDTIKTVTCSGARIKVNWGQYWPENIYCSNKLAGCVPVAISLALSYFKPDTYLTSYFDGIPSDDMKIDWESLTSHKLSLAVRYPTQQEIDDHLSNCGCDVVHHYQLGALMKQIGIMGHAAYHPTVTGIDPDITFNLSNGLLSSFNPTRLNGSECYDKLKDGGIALIGGFPSFGSGHVWAVDGVGTVGYDIWVYYNYNPKTHQYSHYEYSSQLSRYVHYNWGWHGLDNGYFLEGVFDSDKGVSSLGQSSTRYAVTSPVEGYYYYWGDE